MNLKAGISNHRGKLGMVLSGLLVWGGNLAWDMTQRAALDAWFARYHRGIAERCAPAHAAADEGMVNILAWQRASLDQVLRHFP